MTPQQQTQLQEIYEWMQEKKRQQVSMPLDPASRQVINAPFPYGVGSATLTESYNVSGGGGGSVTAPKSYVGTEKMLINGKVREIPYIA